jgi:cysteine desulfurase
MRDPIYLDHNATTPLRPEVVEAMLPYLRQHFGNPSSGHVYGRRAKEAVERARAQVAALLNAAPHEIVFTSGGTEANNLAIQGATDLVDRPWLVTSAVEHPATREPLRLLASQGWSVATIPVDFSGRLELHRALLSIDEQTCLVTVMHANNETGTLQPVDELAEVARARGALVHTDAAQSVGKVPVDVRALGVDLLSIAGHKLYAPKGVGALFVREGLTLPPLLRGAGHERGVRPGTENVAAIVALGEACRLAAEDLEAEGERVQALRDRLLERLAAEIEGLALNGHPQLRLPNTLNVRFPGVSGNAVLAGASEVAASTGSACHDHGEAPSAVLLAQGLSPAEALGAVRLTLGRGTTEAAVDEAAEALVRAFYALPA